MTFKIDKRIREIAKKVSGKRARTVIDHILEHGFITTQDLAKYGYNHPPRAIRDVREAGVPIETFRVTGQDNRSIAAYRFGDPTQIEHHKLGGRKVFSKNLKTDLYALALGKCAVCQTAYEARYLQIDHRVPYQVAGDGADTEENATAYMLLCASCQRAKSWTCEQCDNWKRTKTLSICGCCYWAAPEDHSHIATSPIRRLDLTWVGEEIQTYETMKRKAKKADQSLAEYAKQRLSQSEK